MVNIYDNKIIYGDCIKHIKFIPNNNFDLVIADPPYWKVIGEKWDYQWKTEQDYIIWCNEWFKEIYRVLRFGGTFYLFGYFRTLALLIPYLQQIGFDLRQQIIINKGLQAIAGRATKKYKLFPNVTESILFLTKDNIQYSRELLKNRQKALGLTAKEINERLGVKSNGGGMWSIYTGKNICKQLPTKELWNKLQHILDFELKYEKIAQTFNHEMGITDVWEDISFTSEKRYHPTQKPQKLLERLIKASSNEYDRVLDPFAGSGSTYIACKNLNRIPTIIEKEKKYIDIITQRTNELR